MFQNIMLWPSCTQTAGIRLGVVVKCSKGTNRFIYKLHLFDDLIDNLNMFMDFIHVSFSFANYMTIRPVWLSQLNFSSWPPSKGCWEILLFFL